MAADMKIQKFFRNLPKVELHVHLDGSFDIETLYQACLKDPSIIDDLDEESIYHLEKEDIKKKMAELKKTLKNGLKTENRGFFWELMTLDLRQMLETQREVNPGAQMTEGNFANMLEKFSNFLPLVKGKLIDILETRFT